MGEYEDLNDLVRDGSKKLRNSKSLSDEAILMYNRPRQLYPPPQSLASAKILLSSGNSQFSATNTSDVMYGSGDPAMSPTSTSGPASQMRKFICSPDKNRSTYKQVPVSSAPPKLKSNPRDTRSSMGDCGGGGAGGSSRGGRRSMTSATNVSSPPNTGYHYGCNPLGNTKQPQPQEQQQAYPNYFQQQCNFFPGNSDWTEALGFSVNSLWNCGANGDNLSPTMSPNSNPSSPRSHQGHVQAGAPPVTVAGGGGVMYHTGPSQQASAAYHHTATNSGYHQSGSGNGYHRQSSTVAGAGGYSNNGGGYNYSSTYRNEERNPSYGYGNVRGGNSPGVRDTVVM